MASKAVAKATAGGVVEISKKYTLQSTGIWEVIRRFLAIDPNRSNGVPLNPVNRNPAPGSIAPSAYRDPVTAPAGDIAGNPYWKRDHRRNYPVSSVVTQPDVVGLLAVGSAAAPKAELIGEAGAQALVAVAEQGKGGVAAFLEQNVGVAKEDVFVNGLPPTPSGTKLQDGAWQVHPYQIGENSYPER
ncbi:hypothetical protein TD95_001047 [Thielaviopsis punctulata]|uniref:NADH-ubiquinone oxidoreductase 21.3 kDa subunit n=1 Tax=Thielaviopsis punctulata TaxID=72032 RepID=A0A0F4Z9C4_9PEZI|nr:hypothetical protein TD95_001047 [Thielaviopsis punctulata]